ncbi:DASH complex subunit DAD2, partial [Aspergillus homomorphus CBS 101889]
IAYPFHSTTMLPSSTSAAASFRSPNQPSAIAQQSSALAARIASKKAELENLKQLRDMSSALAGQMQSLEAKIGTLRDGTEAVACVLTNWDNVLRAIGMASALMMSLIVNPVSPRPTSKGESSNSPLPATLVRVPVENRVTSEDR